MKYNENRLAFELSVRELCETALKCGDIDFSSRSNSGNAMLIGAEVHRKIQSEAGAFYTPEVTLRNTSLSGGIYFTVSGRADGIIRENGRVVIDEIKTVRPYAFAYPPTPVHLAQMKCYAYFVTIDEELPEIGCRMTYCEPDSMKINYFDYKFTSDELKEFYFSLLAKIHRYAEFYKKRITETLPGVSSMPFPYPELREGQEIMIRECYSAIRREKRLFAEAPTGTGKTISALYPAARALGEGLCDKVFYLTAKSSTRREAFAAAGKLFEAGAKLRTVVIEAKESVCSNPAKSVECRGVNMCNPYDCARASGYYDRVDNAIFELLAASNGYNRKAIEMIAEKYGVCRYELSLDLSLFCDIIICDYNYVFDPIVYFRRYFAEGEPEGRCVFLADEAHNLPDRARDMYSAELERAVFEEIYRIIPKDMEALNVPFEKMILTMRGLKKLCRDSIKKDLQGREMAFYMSKRPITILNSAAEEFYFKCDTWLKKNRYHELSARISELLFSVKRHIVVNEYFDEGFLCYLEILEGQMRIKTYCLDPAKILDAVMRRARASVLFSATLTPRDYFADVLGGTAGAVQLSLPSPFAEENLGVAIVGYLGTRQSEREGNYVKYANVIAATVSAMPGNYIAYFPSYACLDGVHSAFLAKYPKVSTIPQKPGMTPSEREAFIERFKDDTQVLRVGFCVLGGAFAEGVDLPGSRLIGCIIFGVGLPGLSNEKNIIRDYYELKNESGYDYAYTYPGMNNVLQAAGRVIRRDEDRGIIVLCDDRFAEQKYFRLFPLHWKNIKIAGNAASLAEIARKFWQNEENRQS